MDKPELISTLKEIIKPYVQDEAAFQNLTEDTHFIDDLKINSANLIDVALDVEDKFDIVIEDEALGSMFTVKEAMDIVSEKITAK